MNDMIFSLYFIFILMVLVFVLIHCFNIFLISNHYHELHELHSHDVPYTGIEMLIKRTIKNTLKTEVFQIAQELYSRTFLAGMHRVTLCHPMHICFERGSHVFKFKKCFNLKFSLVSKKDYGTPQCPFLVK